MQTLSTIGKYNITAYNKLAPATKPALVRLSKSVPLGRLQATRYLQVD